MSHAGARQQVRAGKPRAVLPLVRRHRVHHVGVHANIPSKLERHHRAQVSSVFPALGPLQLPDHHLVYQVSAAGGWPKQTAASGHGSKRLSAASACCVSGNLQRFANQLGAIPGPRQQRAAAELRRLVLAMTNRLDQLLTGPRVYAEFGRRRSGVDGEDQTAGEIQASPLACLSRLRLQVRTCSADSDGLWCLRVYRGPRRTGFVRGPQTASIPEPRVRVASVLNRTQIPVILEHSIPQERETAKNTRLKEVTRG